MKKYLMLAAALMWSTPARSRNVVSNDGNELLELCSNSDYFSQAGFIPEQPDDDEKHDDRWN